MKRGPIMHALAPDLEHLIDQALLLGADDEDQAFLDALVEADRCGELTREQALTLASLLGRSRAAEIARGLTGASP
jgi:hypothetical protein